MWGQGRGGTSEEPNVYPIDARIRFILCSISSYFLFSFLFSLFSMIGVLDTNASVAVESQTL